MIRLNAGSGQNQSPWFPAGHYGLRGNSLLALPMAGDVAGIAMVVGLVEAVFRLRATGNPTL